ncbi:DUF6165 family protein [Pelagibacteraceae bacterium]|nr:DUF6165 family protein [Pelagibacteraceae bacterium]
MIVNVPVSVGELIDKVTILEIKSKKIKNSNKNTQVKKELKFLMKIIRVNKISINKFKSDYIKLKKINEKLWNIENKKRKAETKKIFDDKFIRLARNVYLYNDKRAQYKLNINKITNSELIEVKSHE